MDRGEERGVLAEAGDVGEADRGVDVVGLAAAAAAELHHHEAERARRRSPRRRRLPVDLAAHGASARCFSGASSRSAGPPSSATMRAKRSAAAPECSAASASASTPTSSSAARAQLQRHLDQPRLAGAVAQHVDRLAHLERVAGRAAEHLVHVGQQRGARQAGALGDLGDRAAELGRLLARGHERAGAGLDVHHQRVEPLGELLGEDRGDDQRDRLDGAGGVAQRVEAAVGGRELGGLADDRAARARATTARRRVELGRES